jgi:multidrug efflux pump
VDGSNTTLNAGRLLINLKPLSQRSDSVTAVIARLQRETAAVAGARLYMQPVQDLTIDSTVSRAQYQFFLENPDGTHFNTWCSVWPRSRNSPPSAAT